MGSKNPRLQFTDAEQSPKLKKHVRRAEKAAEKAEKARAKIPKDRKKLKRRMIDQQAAKGQTATGKSKKKSGSALQMGEPGQNTAKGKKVLRFEEVEKPAPSKLQSIVRDAPGNVALGTVHQKIGESEDDNVGVESAHRLEETAEAGGRLVQHSARSHKLKPYREAARAERNLEKANIDALYQKALQDNPQLSSNPLSRWQQRQAIKKQYAAARKAGQAAGSSTASAAEITRKAAENSAKAAKKAAEESKKAGEFIWRHKKGFAIVIGIFAIVAIFLNMFSSCSVLVEGMMGGLGGSSFVSRDEDMLGAEAAYAGLEANLQNYLDTYTSTHDYDEYHFDLDEITHDPYVLISLLTAYYQGEWTLTQAQSMLNTLFDMQYTLTETVVTETRYDADDEPYTYYICYVTLVNNDLSHLPILLLSEEQMEMYATYIATQGNRPDLFPSSEYPGVTQRGDYMDYDVPPEALADEQFAAILNEAEKYLGYPYVWGGSSPSTSFDCSGFVSWVINHSGWNVGRLGAVGLKNICTIVSPSEAKPGDLIFFHHTYNAPDPSNATHVGIYVGNNMMIHCGDPISYANLNSSYWQQHFLCYGRLP